MMEMFYMDKDMNNKHDTLLATFIPAILCCGYKNATVNLAVWAVTGSTVHDLLQPRCSRSGNLGHPVCHYKVFGIL